LSLAAGACPAARLVTPSMTRRRIDALIVVSPKKFRDYRY
jgi:hypothetical protein